MTSAACLTGGASRSSAGRFRPGGFGYLGFPALIQEADAIGTPRADGEPLTNPGRHGCRPSPPRGSGAEPRRSKVIHPYRVSSASSRCALMSYTCDHRPSALTSSVVCESQHQGSAVGGMTPPHGPNSRLRAFLVAPPGASRVSEPPMDNLDLSSTTDDIGRDRHRGSDHGSPGRLRVPDSLSGEARSSCRDCPSGTKSLGVERGRRPARDAARGVAPTGHVEVTPEWTRWSGPSTSMVAQSTSR